MPDTARNPDMTIAHFGNLTYIQSANQEPLSTRVNLNSNLIRLSAEPLGTTTPTDLGLRAFTF